MLAGCTAATGLAWSSMPTNSGGREQDPTKATSKIAAKILPIIICNTDTLFRILFVSSGITKQDAGQISFDRILKFLNTGLCQVPRIVMTKGCRTPAAAIEIPIGNPDVVEIALQLLSAAVGNRRNPTISDTPSNSETDKTFANISKLLTGTNNRSAASIFTSPPPSILKQNPRNPTAKTSPEVISRAGRSGGGKTTTDKTNMATARMLRVFGMRIYLKSQ